MNGRRVFISGRIGEMKEFRKAAERAITRAGMEPFSITPDTLSRTKLVRQLEEGVKTSDAFIGLYGYELEQNWTPRGRRKHSIELELGWAMEIGLPCFCYTFEKETAGRTFDADMLKFRASLTDLLGYRMLTTPAALEKDLLPRLRNLRPRVFISYSSKDKKFATDLYRRLKESGHNPWFNVVSIDVTKKWNPAMMQGLADTSVIVLVVSPDSIASKWVNIEWQEFFKHEKPIIQLLYREAKTPQKLKAIQGIKYEDADKNWYFRLLKTINACL